MLTFDSIITEYMQAVNTKQVAAEEAVTHIQNGMTVGLGTGSTAAFAIQKIGARVAEEGLQIKAIATSDRSEQMAHELQIPIVGFEEIDRIDITIDGADEVDEHLNLIKGGGGALLREKIVSVQTQKNIIIVDETKLVKHLGAFPLPVEVVPFALTVVKRQTRKTRLHHNCSGKRNSSPTSPTIIIIFSIAILDRLKTPLTSTIPSTQSRVW